MLDYRSIRARYELAIRDALLPLDVPLHYDNVQEQPIPDGRQHHGIRHDHD